MHGTENGILQQKYILTLSNITQSYFLLATQLGVRIEPFLARLETQEGFKHTTEPDSLAHLQLVSLYHLTATGTAICFLI